MKKLWFGCAAFAAVAIMGCSEESPLSTIVESEKDEVVTERDIQPGFIDVYANNFSYQTVSQEVDRGEFIKVSVIADDIWKVYPTRPCDYKGVVGIKGGRYAPMPEENWGALVFDFCGEKRVLTKSYGEIFFASETDNLKAKVNEYGRAIPNNEGHIGVRTTVSEADYTLEANELRKWTTDKIAYIKQAGYTYEFVAKADWTVYNPVVAKHDADGSPDVNWNISSYPVPGGPVGALIGKVGLNGKPFVMGKKCKISINYKGDLYINGTLHDTNVSSGGLYVVINDTPKASHHHDNVGTCYIGRFRV